MNQLEEIKKLYTTTKEIKIPKEAKDGEPQATLTIRTLSYGEMSKISPPENASSEDQIKSSIKMMALSLDISEADVENISLSNSIEIMNAITEVNNFTEDDMKKTGALDLIKKRKEQIEQAKSNGKSA